MSKIKLMVICGGRSNERDVSLNTGQNVYKNLNREKYEATLVDIKPNLEFVVIDSDVASKVGLKIDIFGTALGVNSSITKEYDLVFNALHGEFGEDGKVQAILEIAGLKYTHSGVMASSIGMDKTMTTMLVSGSGLKTPMTLEFKSTDTLESIVELLTSQLKYPFFIKPNSSGSSQGIYKKIIEENELFETVNEIIKQKGTVEMLAQEYIEGRELTCPVVGNKKGEIVTMPVGEIITGAEFFDYNAKYFDASTEEIFPANIDRETQKIIQDGSVLAHTVVGCDGLTRSDFIMTKEGEVYFIEINTNPGLASTSLTPRAAKAMDLTYSELLDILCEKALEK
jgi:D-alanine-D-alanine ligase